MVFQEAICVENKWDGLDVTHEFYWKDVPSVKFDQTKNEFKIAAGGDEIVCKWQISRK